MQDTIMSSDIYMQDIFQQRPLTYSLASSDICKMPRQRPLTYARHQEWHPLTCVQDASNMTAAPSTILRNFLCLSLCAAISITTTIHDRLPRHRQLCIRSCQSIHVIIVIYDTPTMTAGGNRGERRDNTKKGQRHHHRCRTIFRGIVDVRKAKKSAAQDFKFSRSRFLLSRCNRVALQQKRFWETHLFYFQRRAELLCVS